MGGSSIGYLLREGARNIYANKQMSVAAIGVLVACMLLIGASIVFSFNANSFVGYVEAQNEVVVFLKDNLSDDRISEVEQQLKNTENVSAVRFISKEEGLDSWVQSMSGVAENSEELFAPLYEDNIMPDSFSVTIRDLSQLDATVQVLSDYDDVDYVRAPEQVAQTITIIKHLYRIYYRSGLIPSNALAKIKEELPQIPEVLEFIQFCESSKRGVLPPHKEGHRN